MFSRTDPGKTQHWELGLARLLERFRRLSKNRSRRFVHKLMTLAPVLVLLGACGRTEAEVKPGDLAPDFSLPGSDGRTYTLADFRGKQVVVLAWFPKAFTGG